MQLGVPFELSSQAKHQFLHYLRYILREITYLPDPAARSFHHAHILSQFRAYRPLQQEVSESARATKTWIKDEKHLESLLKSCRDTLDWHYRASNGDMMALKKALFLAYGREGPRKRQLLHPFIKPDVPENVEKLERTLNNTDPFKLPLSKALHAITREQSRQDTSFMSATDINTRRFLGDILPRQNSWGRPMPRVRLVNARRKQFAQLTDKLYPPLPEHEFSRLQGLATGAIPCPPLPTRRKRLEGLPELPKMTSGQNLSKRTMRRLWTELLAFCSTIEKNNLTSSYKVTWARPRYSATNAVVVGNNNSRDTALFSETIEPM